MGDQRQAIGRQSQQKERLAEDDESRTGSERAAAGDVNAGQILAGLEVEVIQLEDSLSLHRRETLGALVEVRRGNDDGLYGLTAGDRLNLQGLQGDGGAVLLNYGHVLQHDGVQAAGRIDLVRIDDVRGMDADLESRGWEGQQNEQQGDDTPHDFSP